MIAIVPGYISRSVAGSYDNEGIAIFCMLLTYFMWIKSVKTGSLFWSTLCALAYFYMVGVPRHLLQLMSPASRPGMRLILPRGHKNGQLEEECATPIETCSPVKIIELYQKKNTRHVLSNMSTRNCAYMLLFLVWFNNSDRFGILRSYTLFL